MVSINVPTYVSGGDSGGVSDNIIRKKCNDLEDVIGIKRKYLL